MWCETLGRTGAPGPHLGIHLGMGGRLIVTDAAGERGGGEPVRPDRTPRKAEWDRFTLVFADGGACGCSTSAGSAGCGSTPTSTRSARTPR